MKFTMPESMPCRADFLTELLDAVFPDLDTTNRTKGAYAYTDACCRAAEELGIPYAEVIDEACAVDVESDIFRLMYEMNDVSYKLFGKDSALINAEEYKTYKNSIFTFCSHQSGSLKGWLDADNKKGRINKSFDTALFFTYLLLSRSCCAQTRADFIEKCLGFVGITELDNPVAYEMYDFDWKKYGKVEAIGGRNFRRLGSRAIILSAATILTITELLGTNLKRNGETIKALQQMFRDGFRAELSAVSMFDSAETTVLNSNRFFEPRSIQITRRLYPQDFFVMPRFCRSGENAGSPIAEIKGAAQSKRLLVMAKTGLGKSAFLQMVTLCLLKKHYTIGSGDQERLDEFSDMMDIPDDMFVISVPARMFSFCYKDARYSAWTNDFVRLFFNCMWNLSSGYNFYSTQNSQRFTDELRVNPAAGNMAVTEELLKYVYELARRGKLLLILDSFDEISSGEMRNAYLKALAAFYDSYCCFPEKGEVGAHVIVSSRQMSPGTMHKLEYALELDARTQIFGIQPLCAEQRRELVFKWNRFEGISDAESEEILRRIEHNHYYLDYSVNPYMLSVVCFYFGDDLGNITQRFIMTLTDRMLKNNRMIDSVAYDVLMNITKILQDVAGETITDGNPHFSRRKLDGYITRSIGRTDLLEEDVDRYIEQLHEIFVTEVGLIVPADGADSDYQFINDQIRFELAAKGIQRALRDDEKITAYRDGLFPSIKSPVEYVGLLVPLLCDIKLENVRLAEMLISDLAMYDFADSRQAALINTTMLDLILNRYGGNILTAANPGDNDARYVRKAQRMVMMRLLTSPYFTPTPEEKEELLRSSAFAANEGWLSENVISVLK